MGSLKIPVRGDVVGVVGDCRAGDFTKNGGDVSRKGGLLRGVRVGGAMFCRCCFRFSYFAAFCRYASIFLSMSSVMGAIAVGPRWKGSKMGMLFSSCCGKADDEPAVEAFSSCSSLLCQLSKCLHLTFGSS